MTTTTNDIVYQLVWTFEGLTLDARFSADNIIPAMDVRGFTLTGICRNPRLRAELQGQPTFRGLIGPCYGGPGVIRYECPETYTLMSC